MVCIPIQRGIRLGRGEIFSLPGGGWAAVSGRPDPFAPHIGLTFFSSSGEATFHDSFDLPPFPEGNANEWFHAFCLNGRGDLTALYGWARGRPGGIIRITDFAGGNRKGEFIPKETFAPALPLSPDGPFTFRNLRYRNGRYYITVDMKPDPYDGVLILDDDLTPKSYNTGYWTYNCPWDVAADDEGRLYASNFYHDTVKIYNSEGILARTADDDKDGYRDQYMNNPGDVALHGETLYVYDSGNGRIARFSSLIREPAGMANPSQLVIPYRLGQESLFLYFSFFSLGTLLVISLNGFVFAFALGDKSFFWLGAFFLCALAFFINNAFSRFFLPFPKWNLISPFLMMICFLFFLDTYLDRRNLPPWYGKTRNAYLILYGVLHLLSLLSAVLFHNHFKDVLNRTGDVITLVTLLPLGGFLTFLSLRGEDKCRDLLKFFGLILFLGLVAPGTFTMALARFNLIYAPLVYHDFPLQLAFILGGFFLTFLITRRVLESRTQSARERERSRSLEEAHRRQTHWTMTMSHELRTPLTLILGITDQLRQGRWGDSIQKNRPHLDAIERNGNRLISQINDFLALSRFEQRERALSLRKINLARFLEQTASDYASLAASRNILFTVPPPGTGYVHADPELLKTALDNLLSNAFKFTSPGDRVSLATRQEPDGVALTVTDSGPGIAPKDRDRIFSPFEQAEGAFPGGVGLGLALVREIMTLHGGRVELTDPGAGAAFTLFFPRWEKEPELWLPKESEGQEEARELPMTTGNVPYRVMVVEDNRELMAYLVSELSPHFRLICAEDGLDALEKAKETPPDLIISDIMMPRMDGRTLYDELGEDRPPFLFLTARADKEEKLDALDKGAADYMEKPFSSRELVLRAKGLLDRSRREREVFKQDLKKSLIRFVDAFDPSAGEPHNAPEEGGGTPRDLSLLTPREREIYDLILQGMSDKEVGQKLNISVKTVGNHNSSLFRKLNVSGRRELILTEKGKT